MGRYIYNKDRLKYEQIDKDLRSKVVRILTWGVSSMVIGLLLVVLYSLVFDTPRERELRQENISLMEDYEYLSEKYARIDTVIRELQDIDQNIYRAIFETEPVNNPDETMPDDNKFARLMKLNNREIVFETYNELNELLSEVELNSSEYYYLENKVVDREKELESIPAIQPIRNPDLSRMASGFGNRLHPFYKIIKFHEGTDFTAPAGTEVRATGNGTVIETDRSRRGKGNTIIIDHGNGYQSMYSHLDEFKVRRGAEVERGEIIGTVGNTGLSVAPHLHYEVRLNGKPVNPVNYFFLELSPRQYIKMVEISIKSGQSFD